MIIDLWYDCTWFGRITLLPVVVILVMFIFIPVMIAGVTCYYVGKLMIKDT